MTQAININPIWRAEHVQNAGLLPDKLVKGRAYFVDDQQIIVINHGAGNVIYGGKPGPQGAPGEPQPMLQYQIDQLAKASITSSETFFDFVEKVKKLVADINAAQAEDYAALIVRISTLDTKHDSLNATTNTRITSEVAALTSIINNRASVINARIDSEVSTLNSTIENKASATNSRIDSETQTLNETIADREAAINDIIKSKYQHLVSMTGNVYTSLSDQIADDEAANESDHGNLLNRDEAIYSSLQSQVDKLSLAVVKLSETVLTLAEKLTAMKGE